MKIQIREREVDVTASLRAQVDRRLHFALGRFGARIGHVNVRFWDTGGQRGGGRKACEIDVVLSRSGSVHVEDTGSDLFTALDSAAGRVSRAVAHAVDRSRWSSSHAPH